MNIEGRTALITGAGSGIGAAIARALDASGAKHVVVTDLDEAAAEAVADVMRGSGHRLDVADQAATSALVDAIERDIGPIDLVFLNAGVAVGGSFDASDDEWDLAWQVNVMGHVHMARAVVPRMLERGEGYVVTTASAAGLLTNIDAAPYSVTKHGAVALAEWLAVTYGRRGLRVSCLCPQFVDTPMLDVFADGSDQLDEWVHGIAVTPELVARTVVDAIGTEQFLILPHPEVAEYFRNKADDYDRWIAGMQKLQSAMVPGT